MRSEGVVASDRAFAKSAPPERAAVIVHRSSLYSVKYPIIDSWSDAILCFQLSLAAIRLSDKVVAEIGYCGSTTSKHFT
jgi:hypothetical protein